MRRLFNKLLLGIVLIACLALGIFSVQASVSSTACAVTPDKLDGQGLNVSGLGLNVSGLGLNVSGLSLEQIVQDIWTNPVTPAWLTQLLPGVEGGGGYNSVPAVILIVDDFSTPTAHGHDVRKVFTELLSAINAVRDPDPLITLVNVDISGANYDSMLIATAIRNTVNSLLPTYQHFAVNMSFGLVPCEDPVGATIIDSESGASFTMTKVFNFSQMQTTIATKPVIQNASLIPLLDCVVDRGKGNLTAYFGYQNNNTVSVNVPVGNNNYFHQGAAGQGQVTVFMPGVQHYVFKVDFKGALKWYLRGPDNKTSFAMANNGKPLRCTGTPTLRPIQSGLNGYGGLTQFAQQTLGVPDKFIDDYLEYLANKGAAMDDPLNGLRPLLRGYLQRSAQEAADADPNTRFALIPLASAGNFRPSLGSAPLAPARFPETIAVSATLGTFGNLWALSQDGNVRAPGAGYILAKDASGGVTRVGAGTSFAAPYVTTLAALWLTYPNACQFTGGQVPLTTDPAAKNTNSIAAITGNSIFPLACSKNTAPVVSLTSSITMTEGQQLSIGTVSNAGGGAITLASSLSGSSVVDVSGNVVFSHNDGPLAAQTVTITATNALGAQTSAPFTLTVDNVAPTGQLSATLQTITAGDTLTLTMGSPFDPGAVDTATGFSYAFDCGSGAGVVSTASTNTLMCTYPTSGSFTAHGLIRDKDGAMGESTLPITVNPVSESTGCYATSVLSYVPGTRKNGTAIESGRVDPSKALGAPQMVDSENFVSLGFGDGLTTGLLILDLYPNAIQNGEGLDVRIWETSFNDGGHAWNKYPEAAQVFASQDLDTWVLLGKTTDKDQAFDLITLNWARYIKLVDVTSRTGFGKKDDGFDVDAVKGFACLPIPSEEYYDESSFSGEAIVIVTEEAPIVDIPAEPTTEPAPVIIDTDGDTVPDSVDNCPALQTTNVTDTDGDGVGNACDETPNGVIIVPEVEVVPPVDTCAVDAVDTDADGVFNPCDTDDDNDGLSDTDESTLYQTDPLLADSDADGIADGAEITNGTNPLHAGSL